VPVDIAVLVPVCEVVDDGCESVLVLDAEPLPRAELLFDIPDELRTLFSALELA